MCSCEGFVCVFTLLYLCFGFWRLAQHSLFMCCATRACVSAYTPPVHFFHRVSARICMCSCMGFVCAFMLGVLCVLVVGCTQSVYVWRIACVRAHYGPLLTATATVASHLLCDILVRRLTAQQPSCAACVRVCACACVPWVISASLTSLIAESLTVSFVNSLQRTSSSSKPGALCCDVG